MSLSLENEDEALTLFNSLAKGGQTIIPFNDAFWGGKFGMLVDQFGV